MLDVDGWKHLFNVKNTRTELPVQSALTAELSGYGSISNKNAGRKKTSG